MRSAPALGSRVELRKPSRLILVGDIRAPRIVGRMEPLGSVARLTLDVAPATPHTIAQDGTRLIVRFEADTLDAALPRHDVARSHREHQAWRGTGHHSRSTSVRASPRSGRPTRPAIGAPGASSSTWSARRPRRAAAAGARRSRPPQERRRSSTSRPSGTLRVIVIDAGHGGSEEGAKGPGGALEKNVTLAVARRLKAALEARLGVRVILTRDGDATIGLDERAALANNNKADLFVSLHANASLRPATTGAEVFYLSLDEYGDAASAWRTATASRCRCSAAGRAISKLILWDMAQARYIQESAALAQAVEASLRERVPMSPRAIQQAPFRVLVGANMPAVLVEMGFITNAAQEKQLQSDEFQNQRRAGTGREHHAIPRRARAPRAPSGRRADGPPRRRSARPSSVAALAACLDAGLHGAAALVRAARPTAPPPRPRRSAAPAGAGAKNQGDAVLRVRRRPVAAGRPARGPVRRSRSSNRRAASSRRSSRPRHRRTSRPIPAGTALRALFIGERGDAFVDLSGEVTDANIPAARSTSCSRSTRSSTR